MTPHEHLNLMAATIAAGMLASWDRGGTARMFDNDVLATDAVALAREICAETDRQMTRIAQNQKGPV